MGVRETLLSELDVLCKDAGLDFKEISKELSEFLSDEEMVDYCIAQGPLPDYPHTILDIMVLSNKCIHDYELTQQGSLNHILPLRTIIEILEGFEKMKDKDYLSVSFNALSFGTGLVFQCKLADKNAIRRFTRAVARKLVEF